MPGECSTVAAVKASVIQGSGLGPASFIVTAADLHPTTPENRIFKFADDTYLVVPAANSSSRLGEVSHVESWASRNNLRLNSLKLGQVVIKRVAVVDLGVNSGSGDDGSCFGIKVRTDTAKLTDMVIARLGDR